MPKLKPGRRRAQHQSRQPGDEAVMIPRPRMVLPKCRGSRKLDSSIRPRATSRSKIIHPRFRLQFNWASAIEASEWAVYLTAIRALREANIPFLLGGGFALATFTGRWRDTKDIDFYVNPKDRTKAISVLTDAGFEDYFDRKSYDRRWIHRNTKSDVIVDIIWSMANQRAAVDKFWFERAGTVSIRGQELQVIPMEEFLWCKLYILQRDHCDWTDSFNLIYARGHQMNWDYLVNRLGADTPLLKALLTTYGWLCPSRATKLPGSLWNKLGISKPEPAPGMERTRVRWLDSRAWFAALQPRNLKLDV